MTLPIYNVQLFNARLLKMIMGDLVHPPPAKLLLDDEIPQIEWEYVE